MSTDILFNNFFKAAAGGTVEEIGQEVQKITGRFKQDSNIRAKFQYTLIEAADDNLQEFFNITSKRAKTGRKMDLNGAMFAFRAMRCADAAFYLSQKDSNIQKKSTMLYVRAIAGIRTIEHLLPNGDQKPSCIANESILKSFTRHHTKQPTL